MLLRDPKEVLVEDLEVQVVQEAARERDLEAQEETVEQLPYMKKLL